MPLLPQLTGYFFALASAFLWALVAIFYKDVGSKVSPAGITIGKSLVAALCTGALLCAQGYEPAGQQTLFFLVISGILGISLGDTFFFMSISCLRPSMAVLMTTFIPVLTLPLAALFLKEQLSARSWIGSILVIAGIVAVLSKGDPEGARGRISAKGMIYSLLAAACCAASIIFSKCALASTPALEASFIRHLSGLAALLAWGIMTAHLPAWLKPFAKNAELTKKLCVASFLGTFLGTWFCLLGLQFATASAATVLNSTSPLFIIPLSYILLKEKPSKRSLIGSLAAVTGVCCILTAG
ncbi:MAG TPA: EamA family transporter [Patescibacteria group bacterium]|nr:EamA family transporter [Patescibacteria group bacterium]